MEDRKDVIALYDGRILETHDPRACEGTYCCIHNPSNHPLNNLPLNWRADRHPSFMERICEHGVGHPDPDDLAYKRRLRPTMFAKLALGIHGCDGCCWRSSEQETDKVQ